MRWAGLGSLQLIRIRSVFRHAVIVPIAEKPRRQRDKRTELQQLGLISGRPLEDDEGEEYDDEEGEGEGEEEREAGPDRESESEVTAQRAEANKASGSEDPRAVKRARILSVPDAHSPALGHVAAGPAALPQQALHLDPNLGLNAAISALTQMADGAGVEAEVTTKQQAISDEHRSTGATDSGTLTHVVQSS